MMRFISPFARTTLAACASFGAPPASSESAITGDVEAVLGDDGDLGRVRTFDRLEESEFGPGGSAP
jgi:hypothetical protein